MTPLISPLLSLLVCGWEIVCVGGWGVNCGIVVVVVLGGLGGRGGTGYVYCRLLYYTWLHYTIHI